MDPKLAILFMLFGAIIGMANLSRLTRSGRPLDIHFWRRRLPKWPH
jgi:hypothetical protein